jgi:nitroreductase
METLRAIEKRRSISKLVGPPLSADQINMLLDAAKRAPDHKTLRAWEFVVLDDSLKTEIADVITQRLLDQDPTATNAQLESAKAKLNRAPTIIVAATRRVETSLPFEEVLAATAAAIQNMLLLATDLGIGSMWRTGANAYDPAIKKALALSEDDFISGFIYLGAIPD